MSAMAREMVRTRRRPPVVRRLLDWKGVPFATLLEAGITQHGRVIRIPYRRPDGREHNARLVTPQRQWWETTGVPLAPFGLERAAALRDRTGRILFISEGESDALMLRSEYAELRGHRVDVLGVPGANTWRKAWATYVTGYGAAYVFADADRPGQRLAEDVLTVLPAARLVRLPAGCDTRDILQMAGGADLLDAYMLLADETAILTAVISRAPTLAAARGLLAEISL